MATSTGNKPPIQQIYDILNQKFGQSSNQIFQMEFPARLLDKGTYDYVGSNTINAQQIKPQAVVDAEFRLSDDMYPLSRMIGGPNGAKLSEAYNEIIFGLIPTAPANDAAHDLLHEDQEKVCAWLTQEVDDWDPPQDDLLADIPQQYSEHKPPIPSTTPTAAPVPPVPSTDPKVKKKIPRVDLYQKLVDAYEVERFRWVTFKTNARPTDMATASPVAIDNFNRMLANFAPIVDKKLEALWTMVLIRGQYHRVRRLIGLVDVESASEILQRAKENLRASVMRSIDDTEDVYPVYFTPATWASKLSTAFKPEDLLSSEEFGRQQLFQLEKNRATLLARRNAFKSGQKDVKALEDAEIAAQEAFRTTRDDMLKGYSDTAISLVEMYFDAKTRKSKNQEAAIAGIGEDGGDEMNKIMKASNEPPLTKEEFKKLKDMQVQCIHAQTKLQSASEALSRAQLAAATARGSDATTVIAELDEQIQSLTLDIDYLNKSFKASENATGVEISVKDPDNAAAEAKKIGVKTMTVPTKPELPPQDKDASVWQEIVEKLSRSQSTMSTTTTASASHLDWSVNFFIGSASGSESSSSASNAVHHDSSNTDIQVAFRCMKVVMNRPWMDVNVLSQTKDFYRSFSTTITPSPPRDATTIKTEFEASSAAGAKIPGSETALMAAYTTAFIVVKDVHIVMKTDQAMDDSVTSDMQKSMNAGGGFLCFSCAKSESSSEHRAAAAVSASANYLSIKIPAPQIIGWISTLTPQDACQGTYMPVDAREFSSLLPLDGKAKDKSADGEKHWLS